MNKTELRKIAKELINERFEMFSNIRVIELNCERSSIDNELFINYLVIVANTEIYKIHVSEDNFCGSLDIFYKETHTKEDGNSYTSLYNPVTRERTY